MEECDQMKQLPPLSQKFEDTKGVIRNCKPKKTDTTPERLKFK